ncbi:hypothetical protein [Xenorhabdus littoralis]|uniref:hypothetical protein n=1 Tax=Xenorhabdus littoralis TaxID=2582835 RepID=UPI0029E7F2CF|nr:hypothetical protein [Xenorhabdus sp. psl]MDX7992618.1 hypothetical protein [Xenorhabdus sp. psl]
MAKYIHADLLMEYAKLAQETERPWEYFEIYAAGEWISASVPLAFLVNQEYRLKPKTIRIGNIDVPEPVREPLECDQEYFVVATSGLFPASIGVWNSAKIHMIYLERGLIHLDRESAELHAQALIALTAK